LRLAGEPVLYALKILLVEDELWLVEAVRDGLRALGHEVRVATTGADAIDAARAFQPDAVLLDVALPDISGITLANILRGETRDPVRIVAYSGTDASALAKAVKQHMFDAYLIKPASLACIETALAPRILPAG
jgi:DNA-binding response OmpR family regulator